MSLAGSCQVAGNDVIGQIYGQSYFLQVFAQVQLTVVP